MVKDNLVALRRAIGEAAQSCGRRPEEIRIVAVSKGQPVERIVEAVRCGLVDIGENRVQEAQAKLPLVSQRLGSTLIPGENRAQSSDRSGIQWHMVGRLQSNKARKAAGLFHWIHSVDSVHLARKLSAAAVELSRRLTVLLEVNTSGEPAKGGVEPSTVRNLALQVAGLPGLDLVGLMTIGPLTDDRQRILKSFYILRDLRDELRNDCPDLKGLSELSMGMSGDYREAIMAGATIVRIGTALFGKAAVD